MEMLICSIGSKQCEATLRFGAEVAKALAAGVVLLGMVKTEENAVQLRSLLEKEAKELRLLGLPTKARTEIGDAEKIVMEELRRTAYDLVAVGALGGQRSRRTLLESVAMRIVEKGAGSVLVIKGDRSVLSRVVVCTSGTEHSRLPVRMGAAVACGAGARVTLLHVRDPMPIMYAGLEEMEETLPELMQTDTEHARELRWAVELLQAQCDDVELELRHGLAPDEILSEAQSGDYDMIVLGSSRSVSGITRLLLGDVTQIVVNRAQRPVLVVRSSH